MNTVATKPLLLLAALVLLGTSACSTLRPPPAAEARPGRYDHMMNATIWYQRAPEARALYHQAFNIARAQLPALIAQGDNRPKAVIVDVDETILNNSPFEAQEILEGRDYSEEFWRDWTQQARAQATPGAVEFSRFCEAQGVEVFYITSRTEAEQADTLRNLQAQGFAFARAENLLVREETSSKKERRDKVAKRFEILMLLGDSLSDFADVFEARGDDWGAELVERYRHEFGKRFIILPNPMYGEWEYSLYGSHNRSDAEKSAARRNALQGFRPVSETAPAP